MACLTDLVNLNLSDNTEKIIAEYIWYGARFPVNLHALSLYLSLSLCLTSQKKESILLGAPSRLLMASPRRTTGFGIW
jgi:hypothetical protein